MTDAVAVERTSERGSALVIALLVTVILALLGISFLLMAETEHRIARNERRSAQAFYAAQSTVRVVKRWFDFPATGVGLPTDAQVDRTQRRMIDESDPYDPADVTVSDGILGSLPYYKQGIDADADTDDDLFDRPNRGGMLHQFLGTEDGPDIVIDTDDPNATAYLATLEQTILPGFPGDNLQLRIARIDLFAPPYVRSGGGWVRYGVATVRVVTRLFNEATQRVVAEREIRAVVSEIPYWGAYGPLHSCKDLTLTGAPMTVHWGAVTAVQGMTLPTPLEDLPRGLPRSAPVTPRSDPLLNSIDWTDWAAEVGSQQVEDPWLRFFAGNDVIAPSVPNNPQPYPSPWAGWTSADPAPGPCCDVYSHVFQDQPLAGCPAYDYEDWKGIASSGEKGVHYFSWETGVGFREDGQGAASMSIRDLTHGKSGIFFFDTRDGLPPHDDDRDGRPDNLVQLDVRVTSNWDFSGVLYLNTESFGFNGAVGVDRAVRAPGEPFLDNDQDGVFDPGEQHLNLSYPNTPGTLFNALGIATSGARDGRGPAVDMPVSFRGLLINQGTFEATGSGTLYGSVVAIGGVTQGVPDGSQPTPRLIFDASLLDGFPPVDWGLPRVTVTGWVTERE
jgi:hypothetical protein